MIPKRIALTIWFGRYLTERDALSACFTRLSGGFMPPSVLMQTRQQINTISSIVDEIEKIKDMKGEMMVPHPLEKMA